MAKNKKRKGGSHSSNPLLNSQQRFLQSLPTQVRSHFFSPTQVTPEQRAEIWEAQADIGEELVNTYAWATPDPRLLKVFQHFSPIIESKCHCSVLYDTWNHPTINFLFSLIHNSSSVVSNMSFTWNSNSISS